MGQAWIGYDMDGTLSFYDHNSGLEPIGAPIPKMVAHLRRKRDAGYAVRIVTARVAHTNSDAFIAHQTALVQRWCLEHLGEVLPVTAEKDFGMIKLYDDRASQVLTNRGEIVRPELDAD